MKNFRDVTGCTADRLAEFMTPVEAYFPELLFYNDGRFSSESQSDGPKDRQESSDLVFKNSTPPSSQASFEEDSSSEEFYGGDISVSNGDISASSGQSDNNYTDTRFLPENDLAPAENLHENLAFMNDLAAENFRSFWYSRAETEVVDFEKETVTVHLENGIHNCH